MIHSIIVAWASLTLHPKLSTDTASTRAWPFVYSSMEQLGKCIVASSPRQLRGNSTNKELPSVSFLFLPSHLPSMITFICEGYLLYSLLLFD